MRNRFVGCCCIATMLAACVFTLSSSAFADTKSSVRGGGEEIEQALQPAAPLAGGVTRPEPSVEVPSMPDDGAPRGPGSDNCAGATVAVNGTNAFDTTTATADGPTHTAAECQFAGTMNNNVWFSYQATCTGLLTVSTCEDLGGTANYDTRIGVYSGTCASLTLIGCNDDDTVNACGATPNFHSTVEASVTSGQTYLISVGGFSAADVGSGSLFISCVAGGDLGACCINQVCTDGQTETACENAGGIFAGFGSTCANTTCPCGEIVWAKVTPANTTAMAGAAPGIASTELGNEIQLAAPTGFRDICRVSVIVQEGIAGYAGVDGTPFDLTCSIWSSCPAIANTAGACGANGATLLGTATTTGVVVPTGLAIFVDIDFNPPLANVPNNIAVMFRANRAGPALQLGGNAPEIGTIPTAAASRCGSTTANNGCQRNFGVNNAFAFIVEAQESAGSGSCCDVQTGVCQDGVFASACTGPTQVFTIGGTCSGPGTCPLAMGACCLPADPTCLDGQTINQCATLGGTFIGDGTTCATANCPQNCQNGSEGQIVDFAGHGAGNTVGGTSDLNPGFGFRISDNFTPAVNGTLTSVRWWGFYRDFGLAVPCNSIGGDSSDAFTITFFNDAADTPFQVLAGPFNVTPTVVDTGNQVVGHQTFQYTVSGLNVPVTADRCFWMEIVNNTTGNCAWLWNTGPTGDLVSSQHTGALPYEISDVSDYDLAWCVNIDINPDGCDSAIEIAGACCLDAGTTCDDTQGISACLSAGGSFIGFQTTCAPGICNGACCNPNDFTCSIQVELNCLNLGRVFQGVGTVCTPNPCQGACCLGDGTCAQVSQIECESALPGGFGGSFTGGASCGSVVCSQNDICLATVLNCNSSTTFNNAGQANLEAFDPNTDTAPLLSCFGGVGGDNGVGSFWVTFTGTGSDVEVSTCNSAVDDTVIAVYEDNGLGCTGITAADEVACSEDDDSCPVFQSKVCVPTTNGTQYWVQVTSFDDLSVGSITIDVTCPCPVAGCATCPGDVSGDSTIDGEDIAGFVSCLLGGGSNCVCGDMNADTLTNLNDISGFVTALLNSTGPCP